MPEPVTWTKDELKKFEEATDLLSSPYGHVRLQARLELVPRLEEKYGTAKCQAMHEHLVARDAKLDMKRKGT